jgi:hypothetical protein
MLLGRPTGSANRPNRCSWQKQPAIAAKVGDNPDFYMPSGHAAPGFWSEGSGDKNKAIEYYREALGSYMDDMIEYDFAAERIKKLRQASR